MVIIDVIIIILVFGILYKCFNNLYNNNVIQSNNMKYTKILICIDDSTHDWGWFIDFENN